MTGRDGMRRHVWWYGLFFPSLFFLFIASSPFHTHNSLKTTNTYIQLLACGLGALANPFIPLSYSDGTPESVQSTSSVSGDFDTATSYYFAARKRLGLLSPSLIHVQCLFLCGIFEMYLLNALQAWFYFNQACVQFQNLWTRSRRGCGSNPDASTEVSHKVRRLEQRLYWSCMKSEW